MPRVYISLGSNIDREFNISSAIKTLQSHFGELRISTIYENPAIGFKGPAFYNLVIGLTTNLDPRSLVNLFRTIEIQHGRNNNSQAFTSRGLDIDLLLYDQWIHYDDRLELPHGDILGYAFVLCPLAEIAGDLVHPLLNISIKELWHGYRKDHVELTMVEMGELGELP